MKGFKNTVLDSGCIMRIAINTLGPSKLKAGVGNYVYELVRNLAQIDKNNEYFIIANTDNATLFQMQQKNVHVIHAPRFTTHKNLRIIWEQVGIPLICWQHHIDILHSPGFVAPLFLPCKSVVTIHDMTFFSHPRMHEISKLLYYWLFIPLSAWLANAISADSENTRKETIRYLRIAPKKIKTIHLAANPLCKPVAKTKAKQHLAKTHNIHHSFILFVGTLEPRKNIAGLIDSYARANPTQQLAIVGGKGWQYNSLFQKVKELGIENKVVFTGYVPDTDLSYFYSAADLFVYPSFYEGFGIPPLEALQCGCPVLTSNVSSIPEVVGDAAILIDPTKDFSSAITSLLADERKQTELRTKGFLQAKKFSWKTCAQQTLTLYTTIMNHE